MEKQAEDSWIDYETPASAIHMLRTMQQHHVSLSAMADQKASMLIGASFVVLTILLGQATSVGISLPLSILSVSALLAALFAVIAVIPRVKSKGGAANLLFFGSFTRLDEQEYIRRMQQVLKNENDIHESMLRDVYQLGCVLHRKKYRYLAYSYRTFLIGLVLTFLAYLYSGAQTLLR